MDESKRRAIQFLEKEIKTYVALALFPIEEGRPAALANRRQRGVLEPGVLQRTDERG